MLAFLQRLRVLFKRIFFWHEGNTRTNEQIHAHTHDHALVVGVTKPKTVPKWRQLRYAARVFNRKEKRMVAIAALLFIVTGSAAATLLFGTHVETVPAVGGRVIEAVVGAPKYPHPFYASTNDPDQDLTALVYAGLFRRTDGSRVAPDLVERYEWTEDGTRLTLALREDARFHDGVPVTAADVAFTIAAAKDVSWKSNLQNALRGVSIESAVAREIVLTLDRADTGLLDTLTFGILPAHIWQDIPPGSAHLADANIKPIGAGPFRVRSFIRDTRGAIVAYTLERNSQYHGLKPYIQFLELRFFPDHVLAEEALRAGQVDALAFVPGPSVEDLAKHDRLDASIMELPQETIAFFNVNDDTLKDLKVRQALMLAVEREEVVAAQAGIASPVYGPFPFVAQSAPSSTAEERMDDARALLTEAGWRYPSANEADAAREGIRIKANSSSTTPLALTLTVPDVPDLVAVADVLKRRWALLGAEISVHIENPEVLARAITTNRDAQILLWNVLLTSAQDQYPIWWSGEATGRGLNLSNLSDRDVDDAIEGIRLATTTQALAAARQTFTDAVLARAPAAFLTRPGYGYVHTTRIQGLPERMQLGAPSDRFATISDWYVKTGWRWK